MASAASCENVGYIDVSLIDGLECWRNDGGMSHESQFGSPLDGTIRYCPVEVYEVWRSGLSDRDRKEAEWDGDGGVLFIFFEAPE